MRPPAQVMPWLSEEDLAQWVRGAISRYEYQQRLAVWLTYIGPFSATRVADLLQVSKPSVWKWVGKYNRQGPSSLGPDKRGGWRWGYLSQEAEAAVLESILGRALKGDILTAKHILSELEKATGKPVSLAYAYKVLRRNQWRKLGPRPRHVKANQEAQESFKKTSQRSLKKP